MAYNAKILENIDVIINFTTQNQIVNFIPTFFACQQSKNKKLEMYSVLVVTNSSANNQKDWNRNLNDAIYDKRDFFKNINNENNITIKEVNQISKGFKIKNETIDNYKGRILWNVTGGQRYLLILSLGYLMKNRENRKNDIISYYDGNTYNLHFYNYESLMENEPNICDSIPDVYNELYLNNKQLIDETTTLKLIGLVNKEKDNETDCSIKYSFAEKKFISKKEDIFPNSYEDEKKYYLTLFKYLVKDVNDTDLIDNFTKLNKDDKSISKECKKEIVNKIKEKINDKFMSEKLELLKEQLNTKQFGYIFEKIIFFRVLEIIQGDDDLQKKANCIALDFSVNKKSNKSECEELDQIDIFILLKTGRIVTIECKTGASNSDNQKSTMFTSNYLSSIYGLPYLAVPICDSKQTFKKDGKDKKLYGDLNSNITRAIMCSLPCFSLQDINNTNIRCASICKRELDFEKDEKIINF